MNQNKDALIIFAKNPVVGKVKTRLAAEIGDEKAFEVYNKLLRLTYINTKDIDCKKFIFYTGFADKQLFDSSYEIKIQSEGDLGIKMKNAFKEIFKSGYDNILLVGTDCPGLNSNIILRAFGSLDNSDVVIGPANDGGYYLIGMKDVNDFLFEDIKWSTNYVLEDSLSKTIKMNLKYNLLETLTDVDTYEDLLKVGGLLNC